MSAIRMTSKRNFTIPNQGDCVAAGMFEIGAIGCVSFPRIETIRQAGFVPLKDTHLQQL
jgi:hypothetical protein